MPNRSAAKTTRSNCRSARFVRIPLTAPCNIRYPLRHMAPRKSEPATKQDLRLLEQRLRTTKEEIIRHFDLTVETIRHDLLGANADRIELLHDRITRVEQHVGLAPA